MKRKRLTNPQLKLLRRVVLEGSARIYGSSTVRVAHTLAKLGLIQFNPPGSDYEALPTNLGREVAERGGELL